MSAASGLVGFLTFALSLLDYPGGINTTKVTMLGCHALFQWGLLVEHYVLRFGFTRQCPLDTGLLRRASWKACSIAYVHIRGLPPLNIKLHLKKWRLLEHPCLPVSLSYLVRGLFLIRGAWLTCTSVLPRTAAPGVGPAAADGICCWTSSW
jgi:hypothetical protein